MGIRWIVLALALCACGDVAQQQPVTDPDAFTDVTDKTSCSAAQPPNPTILGTWRSRMQDGHGNTKDITMIIGDGTSGTTYSLTCSFPGLVLSIGPVTVPSTVYSNIGEYDLSAYSDSRTGTDADNVQRTCALSIQSVYYLYSPQGQCMLLKDKYTGAEGDLVR